MKKIITKQKVWGIVCMVSCLFNLSCKSPNACSQTSNEENRDTIQTVCRMDTLESGVLCKSVGSYTILDYSYVSPSTVRKYAYDFMGRKVFESGITYAGTYNFVVWDYDEDGSLRALYRSYDTDPSDPYTIEDDDGLSMLVYTLTECSLTDSIVEKYFFDYHPSGHIRRVYDPDNNHEIACPSGGEINFRVYPMDGISADKLTGNDALNIEFRVREPEDGGWKETLYLGYSQIAQMKYKDNRARK